MTNQTDAIKDFKFIQDWCQTIHTKFLILEKNIDRWRIRTTILDSEENKSWINLNLQSILDEVNDITRMMNALQTSILSKDIPSDYLKYATEEIKYFMHEWKFKYIKALKEIFKDNKKMNKKISEDNEVKEKDSFKQKTQLSKLEESLKENQKLMNYIQSNIIVTRQTVLNIHSVSEQSLKNIKQGRVRIRRVQKMRETANKLKKFIFGFSLGLLFLFLASNVLFILNFFSIIAIF